MKAGNRPEQIRQVEADVKKLANQVAILDQELAKTEIHAPIDGIVATPFVERKLNQHLDPGEELCRIVDLARVTVEMQVPEKELADVRPGNPVWMKARSLPSVDLQGRVDFIAPVAQTVNGQQMVVVRSELENADLLLKPDMTGVAKIYCGDRRIVDLISQANDSLDPNGILGSPSLDGDPPVAPKFSAGVNTGSGFLLLFLLAMYFF